MGNINCKFCGAVNNDEHERCFSCNAPLPKRSNLSEKDKQSLANYIKSVDGMLKASQKKADGKIFPILILLSAIGIGSAIGFYFLFHEENNKLFITLSIIWGIVLFAGFGFYVLKFENQSLRLNLEQK